MEPQQHLTAKERKAIKDKLRHDGNKVKAFIALDSWGQVAALKKVTDALVTAKRVLAAQQVTVEEKQKARDDREAFLRAPPARKEAGSDARAASPGEHMRSFMFGEYVTRRTKEIEERMKGDDGDASGEAR